MADNNYCPTSYQPLNPAFSNVSQGYNPVTPVANQPTNSIVWVQGVEGAKAYPVGAGNSALLMDSEESVFYIKSTDASGMPSPLRVFSYEEQTGERPVSDYVTRAELEKRLAELTKEEEHDEPSV